ncbi:hypothetical protein BGW36DRAFT_262496, partial [Talaromyces proteolyticus]
QRRYQRGQTLLNKAYEMSDLCDADVFLCIRFRDTGRMKIFYTDETSIWSSCILHLESYYPIPDWKTPNDFHLESSPKDNDASS